jgi:hypothetical protein
LSAVLQLDLFAPRWSASRPVVQRSAYQDPFLLASAPVLDAAGDDPIAFDQNEWDHSSKKAIGLDVEVFPNFAVICFQRFSDGKRLAFERSARVDQIRDNRALIVEILTGSVTISFNGLCYDLPVIYHALNGATCDMLKSLSDRIVFDSVRPWDVERLTGIRVPRLNHVDLMEPNPSVHQSLKMLCGRLHGRYIVDLPFEPSAHLTPRQMNISTLYCHNDIEALQLLYQAMREPLELRVALGKMYKADFRSRSDAQMGEAIVRKGVETKVGRRIEKPSGVPPVFNYDVPDFIQFGLPELDRIAQDLGGACFSVSGNGDIQGPKWLEKFVVKIGRMSYSMGIGGLHSTESHRTLRSTEERFLLDVDVASQYPNIIMKLGIYPPALGPEFLEVYGELIRDRLAAKAAGDKVRADGGRIALNGVYGKLGSSYSVAYAPNLLVAVTLTGQLAILMLVERAELSGVEVVSANTDGVVFYCPRNLTETLDDILAQWERDTGFKIEKTPYRSIHNSSVNTYIAIKEDGKVKRKGAPADPWSEGDLRGQMSKNPQMTVCSEAIVRYLLDGISLEETIRGCSDPRSFITLIKVSSGGVWRGHRLGRAVRYYWSLDGDSIHYADGTRRVSKTEGAHPMQELTETVPTDLDYIRYCEEAAKLGRDMGIRL